MGFIKTSQITVNHNQSNNYNLGRARQLTKPQLKTHMDALNIFMKRGIVRTYVRKMSN